MNDEQRKLEIGNKSDTTITVGIVELVFKRCLFNFGFEPFMIEQTQLMRELVLSHDKLGVGVLLDQMEVMSAMRFSDYLNHNNTEPTDYAYFSHVVTDNLHEAKQMAMRYL